MRENKTNITVKYNKIDNLVVGYYPNSYDYPNETFVNSQEYGFIEITYDVWLNRFKSAIVINGVYQEYIDLIQNIRQQKLQELETAYNKAQVCKIINGHTFTIPLKGDLFTRDIKGQVDEATKFGFSDLVANDINGKVVIIPQIPKEMWDYFWSKTKPLSTENYGKLRLLTEKIQEAITLEELQAIDIQAVLPPSTLEIKVDLPETITTPKELVEEEVTEEGVIEEGVIEEETEETPPSRQTSDEEEVGEEF